MLDVFSGRLLRRATGDALRLDSLLKFVEDLVRGLAHELKVIDYERLPPAAIDVRDFRDAFVAPFPFVDLFDLVIGNGLAPTGSNSVFVRLDPAATRADRKRDQVDASEEGN